MFKIIKVLGYEILRCDVKIRPLFENTGIPNYFLLAQDIPPRLLDAEMPQRNYRLFLSDEKATRLDLQTRTLLLPSIEQVLWAVGYMSMEMANTIAENPIRFMHHPFRAHMCPFRGSTAWRQICVKQVDAHYCIETLGVTEPAKDALLGYVLAN